MTLKTIIKGFIILLTISFVVTLYRYELVVQDEEIVKPCDNRDTAFPDIYFDTSELNVEILENGAIKLLGTMQIVNGFPENSILKITLDFYKKDRGSWLNTIYNLQRPDFCKAIFDPTEVWHKYTSSIPMEQRKCPLYDGQKFTFNVTLDTTYSVPSPRLAGVYKSQFIGTSKNLNKSLCVNVFVDAYRV